MTLKKQTLFYLIPNILSAVISIVTFPLIVKSLSIEEYGDYTFLSSVASLIGMVAVLGLSTAFSKNLYEHKIGYLIKYNILRQVYLLYVICLISLGIIGVIIFSFYYEYPEFYYFYTFFLLFFRNIKSLPFDMLRKREKALLLMKILIIEKLLLLVGIVFLYANGILTIENLMIVIILQVVIIAIVFLYIFELHRVKITKKYKVNYKSIFKIALPAIPSTISNWVINLSDRMILMTYKGSATVGLYSVNIIMEVYMNMFVLAFHNATYSRFIKWLQSNDNEKVWNAITILFLIFTFMLIGFVFFMKEFIIIFAKPEYFISNWIFLLIANSTFLFFVSHMYQSTLLVQNKIQYIGLTRGVAAIVNIGLNFLLIPIFSIYGALISTFVAYFISQLLLLKLIGFKIAQKTHFFGILFLMNFIIVLYIIFTSDSVELDFNEIFSKLLFLIAIAISYYMFIRKKLKVLQGVI